MSTETNGKELNHYERLGVSPSARPAQIKRAWQRRTGDLGPGSPELGPLNEAAATLLDPVKRAAYDETLPKPEPAEKDTKPARSGFRVDWVIAPTVTALAIIAAVIAGILAHKAHVDGATDTARVEAPQAAEQAMTAVLSYDYRNMSAAEHRALPFLAPAYVKKYKQNFKLLADGRNGQPSLVQQGKTVVTAKVQDTAVADASPDLVHVVVFVDQTSKHLAGGSAQKCSPSCTLQDRVLVTMVKQGDNWLVQKMSSS